LTKNHNFKNNVYDKKNAIFSEYYIRLDESGFGFGERIRDAHV